MPRSNRPVKRVSRSSPLEASSPGLIDLHFHGALGVDLASPKAVTRIRPSGDWLATLAERGLAGFCPTLLSLEPRALLEAVRALGAWIRTPSQIPPNGARPLGLHLEGPFLSPHARGAHPPAAIRPFDPEELEQLWTESQGTLRILTLAPETLSPAALRWLRQFSSRTGVRLNLGHSQASEADARRAIENGFRGVTHAWNAMAFHHREPGILGAALGRKDVTVELIPDHHHVHPTVLGWTRALHSRVAWVSDCTPASESKKPATFGPLRVQHSAGASRLGAGAKAPLAGGGPLLPEQLRHHLEASLPADAHSQPAPLSPASFARQIRAEITQSAHREPLRFLGFSSRALPPLRLHWRIEPGTLKLTLGVERIAQTLG